MLSTGTIGLSLFNQYRISSISDSSSSVVAAVSFDEGRYDPSIVVQAGGQIVKELPKFDMLYAKLSESEFDDLARQNPSIEFVEKDTTFAISSDEGLGTGVNSSSSSSTSTSAEYTASWGMTDIHADLAHAQYTGAGVKIAVLDTGIDYNHPDLADNYKGGYDFVNDDSDPFDDNGHGTHVAGIIAASKNKSGVVGVAPNAELYAIKVSDNNGKGSFQGLVEGIDWAIENHMDIITMSITGIGGSRALQKAATDAYESHGIILVAAVGNGNINHKNEKSENVLYPAAYEDVIGVGSVTKDHQRSSFSLTGSEVELVAPGSFIESDWIQETYKVMSGTSMATPFVTGSIALLLTSDETAWKSQKLTNGDGIWTNKEVRNVLRYTAIDLGEKGKDNYYGYGLVNLGMLKGHKESATGDNNIITIDKNESGNKTSPPTLTAVIYRYVIA